MKTYELNYLISTDLQKEDIEKLNAEISAVIQKEGGTVVKSETIPKTLGYQIKNHGSALWTNLEFSLNPEKITVLDAKLKKEEKILRYLLVIKKDRKEKKGKKIKRPILPPESGSGAPERKEGVIKKPEKKIELKDIDEKLEEMLKE